MREIAIAPDFAELIKAGRILKAERSKVYRERKAVLQGEWRTRIFERDAFKCRACGDRGTAEDLNLAHVTPARAFIWWDKGLQGLDLSYREDNLLTLCGTCHRLQHRDIDSAFDPELKALLERREAMRAEPTVREWLELNQQIGGRFDSAREEGTRRRSAVERLRREVMKDRGWGRPKDILAPVEGGPTWQALGYRPSEACNEPGGPKAIERVARGECAYGCATCRLPVKPCPDCGLLYCEYHHPLHRTSQGRHHFDRPQG